MRFYRLSHGQWSLDEVVEVQGCTCVAFSCYFTMVCVTADEKLLIFAQKKDKESCQWYICSNNSLKHHHCNAPEPGGNCIRSFKGYTRVGWDETGNLLAVGIDEESFCIFYTLDEGHRIGPVAYPLYSFSQSSGSLRQLSWAPGAGRSFFVFSVLTSNEVTLFLFQRPRVEDENSDMSFTEAKQLHLIAQTKVAVEGVTELSWNTSGIRFATAHIDGKICFWALNVSYSKEQKDSFNVKKGTGSNSSVGCGAQYVGNLWDSTDLKLTVLVSKVCEQYLHHSGS